MKLASYNVENLFLRARALNLARTADGRPAIQAQKRLNEIFAKARYTAPDKAKIVELLTELGLDRADDGGEFAILRQNKRKLIKRPRSGGIEVIAEGRGDWIGWVDLKTEEVNEVATRMTARVIVDVDPDVLAVVEAESRPALLRFSEGLLPEANGAPFDQVMLIDGNDERGIDVGIMARNGHALGPVTSHVDDRDGNSRIFSRDCPVYSVTTPAGNEVLVLVNHLKSKIGGGDPRRLLQAKRVKAIYQELVNAGIELIAVVGDLNDTPDSDPLKPLIKQTNLKDISEAGNFDNGGRVGTYKNCAPGDKIDYILLSPALFGAVQAGGIFRMGVWGGTNGTIFPHYDEITKEAEAASDHAAIWADIAV